MLQFFSTIYQGIRTSVSTRATARGGRAPAYAGPVHSKRPVAIDGVSVNEVEMESTLERLRGEFLEMPGLRLTADQVQRLCGVERAMCRAALAALVSADFLRENADGTFARMSDGVWQAARRGGLALGVTRETNV